MIRHITIKKITALICIALLAFCVTGCSKGQEETPPEEAPPAVEEIDLMGFSGGMTYVEVTNMINDPDSYNGKILKIKGEFATTTENDILYYGCVNMDTTQCCVQVVEFEPTDSYTYPDDFPAEGEEIAIKGTINVIYDGNYKYIVLSDTELI